MEEREVKRKSCEKNPRAVCAFGESPSSHPLSQSSQKSGFSIFSRFADFFKNQIKAMELLSRKMHVSHTKCFHSFLGGMDL